MLVRNSAYAVTSEAVFNEKNCSFLDFSYSDCEPPDIKTYLCIYQSIQFPKTQSFSLHKTCLHTAKLVALCYVLDMLTHSLSQVVFEGYTAYTVLFVTPSNKSTIVFPFFSFPFRNTTASITHSASVAVIDNFLTLIPDKL